MAFVDATIPYANVGGGAVSAGFGGAPTGGGSPQAVPLRVNQGGATAPATNVPHRTWVIVFYLFIAAVLLWAGIIFNPKSR